jgi:heme-degrading monooxygenase HmoA
MIARIWRCTVTRENIRPYLQHFETSVLPQVSALDGFSEVRIMERELAGGRVELTIVSLWKTMESIKAFAGDDVEAAVVAEPAQALLVDYDRRVTHHTVVLHAGPDVPSPDLPDASLAG